MLTDQAIRRLQPRPNDFWRADSNSDGTTNNLQLRIRSNGRYVWSVRRMKDSMLLNGSNGTG